MSTRTVRLTARCIARVRCQVDRINLAHDLATEYAAGDPTFDRAAFLAACDVPVGAAPQLILSTGAA